MQSLEPSLKRYELHISSEIALRAVRGVRSSRISAISCLISRRSSMSKGIISATPLLISCGTGDASAMCCTLGVRAMLSGPVSRAQRKRLELVAGQLEGPWLEPEPEQGPAPGSASEPASELEEFLASTDLAVACHGH